MIRVEIPIRFTSESPNPEASLYLMFRSPKIHLYSTVALIRQYILL